MQFKAEVFEKFSRITIIPSDENVLKAQDIQRVIAFIWHLSEKCNSLLTPNLSFASWE